MIFKKTAISLFIICFIGSSLFAQKENSFKIGVNYMVFGNNDVNINKTVDGAPSYSGDGFYSFGLNFIYAPCTCADIETGLEYVHHSVTVKPNLPPEMDNTPYSGSIDLISIPANFRINILKYFFFNGGILFDIDVSKSSPINSQTGIGVNYGLGLKYDFKFGLTAYANPYMKTHSWISFAPFSNREKLDEFGIKCGLTYTITKN